MCFAGRPIIVDWAIPKKKFGKPEKPAAEISTEVKDEPLDEPIQPETDSEDQEESEDQEDSENQEESEDQEESTQIEEPEEKSITRPQPSHDIDEGKTVFLKNVPFNCTNDELKAFMEEIGPVYYAVVCVDPLTEHSKGTAFVKFRVSLLICISVLKL